LYVLARTIIWPCNVEGETIVSLWTAGYRFPAPEFSWKVRSRRRQISTVAANEQWLINDMGFTNWDDNQPDNYGGEDCVAVWPNRKSRWNDARCSIQYCFVCEDRSVDIHAHR